MRGKLFAGGPVGTVAIVDAPVSQWYARRARVTVVVVGLVVDAVVTALLSVFCPLLLAVGLGALAGIVLGLLTGAVVRIWPVLRVLIWWAAELIAALVVVGGPVTLAHLVSWWAALVAVIAATGVSTLVSPVRRFLFTWSNVVIVRHRLRTCFTGIVRGAGGVRPGSLPLILWGRPTLAGELVWLWLRPGLCLEDLDGRTGRIAVACVAKQVRVMPASERYAALLRVDIARRDPLTGEVESPLSLLIPNRRNGDEYDADIPVSPGMPPVGLDLADVEDLPEPPPARGGRR